MATARKVSPEIKEQILELHRQGMREVSIGRLLNLSKTTIRRHVRDLVVVDGVEITRLEYLDYKIGILENRKKQLLLQNDKTNQTL